MDDAELMAAFDAIHSNVQFDHTGDPAMFVTTLDIAAQMIAEALDLDDAIAMDLAAAWGEPTETPGMYAYSSLERLSHG